MVLLIPTAPLLAWTGLVPLFAAPIACATACMTNESLLGGLNGTTLKGVCQARLALYGKLLHVG